MKKMKLNIQLFGATCTVSVKSITQDIITNSSTIVIHCKLATDSQSWNYGGAYMQPTISNQPVVGSQESSQTLSKKKYNLSKSDSDEDDWTFTVYHNDDGTCNNLTIAVAWYVSNSTKGTKYLTNGYTPATIPRASDVSANNGTLNTQMTISITRKDSSFTHTLRYVCGSVGGWIQDSSHRVGTAAYWVPPISLANQNKSGNTVSCTIYCQTYNGNGQTVSSEKSTTITLTIPTMAPTASLGAVSDSNSYKNTYGVFIQNKSKISSTLSGTAQYSDINSYSWQIRQTNSSGTLLASGSTQNISYTPTTSGTLYIYGSVTDKRGASNSTSTTISVTAYSAPTCSLAVSRVNSTSASYTMNGSGTPLSVTGYTANVVTYTLKRGTTTVRSTTDGTSYTGTDTIEDQSYTYILTASDTISGQTDSKTVTISTTFTLMNFSSSGKAMAIGKASEAGASEELFEVGMNTKIDGDLLVNNHQLSIEEGQLVVSKGGIYNILENSYGFAHYTTNGSNGHWFNTDVKVKGNVYGGTGYDRQLAFKDETMPFTTYTGDFNNYIENSYGYVSGIFSNKPDNGPYGFYGTMIVQRLGQMDYCSQIAIDVNTGLAYSRYKLNGTWKDWVGLNHTRKLTLNGEWQIALNADGAGWCLAIPFNNPYKTTPTLTNASGHFFNGSSWVNIDSISIRHYNESAVFLYMTGFSGVSANNCLVRLYGEIKI